MKIDMKEDDGFCIKVYSPLYFDWLQKSIRDPEAIIRHYLATHP